MQAIEFECQALEGIIKVPEQFQEWYGQPVKVILLRSEEYLTLPQENPAIATASYLSLMKQYSYAQPARVGCISEASYTFRNIDIVGA